MTHVCVAGDASTSAHLHFDNNSLSLTSTHTHTPTGDYCISFIWSMISLSATELWSLRWMSLQKCLEEWELYTMNRICSHTSHWIGWRVSATYKGISHLQPHTRDCPTYNCTRGTVPLTTAHGIVYMPSHSRTWGDFPLTAAQKGISLTAAHEKLSHFWLHTRVFH